MNPTRPGVHQDQGGVAHLDFVADLQSGFVWNNSRWRLAYSMIYRSKEFEGQDERDLFGSLSMSVHF